MSLTRQRRLSAGVEIQPDGTVHARVWAPSRKSVDLVLDSNRARSWRLKAEADGYFAADLAGVKAGDRYWLRLDGLTLRPDPVSRYQPDGPHGPSMIVTPQTFGWTDSAWQGVTADAQVIYELHVGTFTPEGTWAAATAQLDALADLGITVVELMPIADFAGGAGWRYVGVGRHGPTARYGSSGGLRR